MNFDVTAEEIVLANTILDTQTCETDTCKSSYVES
jgi:hypothetical protein